LTCPNPQGGGGQSTTRSRSEAALHTTIQAWVEDLDDDAAFMELALSNNQGELSPLEIGFHALKAVPTAKGGRGKKGGLSEYAKRLGKQQSHVSMYRQAAEVLMAVRETYTSMDMFLDKAQHLAAIHKLPPESWPAAVEYLQHHPALSAKDGLSFGDIHWLPRVYPWFPGKPLTYGTGTRIGHHTRRTAGRELCLLWLS